MKGVNVNEIGNERNVSKFKAVDNRRGGGQVPTHRKSHLSKSKFI